MPNVMATLRNIGGALCSTPHSLAGAHYYSTVEYRWQDVNLVEISWSAPNYNERISGASRPKFTIL